MQVLQLREILCISDNLVFEGVSNESVTIKQICSGGNLILTQSPQLLTRHPLEKNLILQNEIISS